ncbi:hypothetical protein SacsacDRAFT_0107 [Saccharibacillus sacchari DSM 19268]|uniref:Uncharacterized protein n=1 Tax=Saccharibacillus sacchari DSM 19268 TaxID=915437 RepID=A0A011A0W3_9BACL|nr:hypothetical protein SacsacDRAFT_0107 [Saccharibacillus sacchari DSM 19268]
MGVFPIRGAKKASTKFSEELQKNNSLVEFNFV